MAKNYDIAVLLDFYGDLLTDKRRDFLNFYYNEDLSLSEIAENEGLTRQGARDAIKRAEEQLIEFEEKLGALETYRRIREQTERIIRLADEMVGSADPGVARRAAEIRAAALQLRN